MVLGFQRCLVEGSGHTVREYSRCWYWVLVDHRRRNSGRVEDVLSGKIMTEGVEEILLLGEQLVKKITAYRKVVTDVI